LTASPRRRNELVLKKLSFLQEKRKLAVAVTEQLRTPSASEIDLLQKLPRKVYRNRSLRVCRKLAW
jgi:hypothetical protein